MITASAVKLKDGRVYVGKRHGDCYQQIKSLGRSKDVCKESTQGFITDTLQFLNREEAYYHAYNEGQCEIQEPFEAKFCEGLERDIKDWKACLFSEDLW